MSENREKQNENPQKRPDPVKDDPASPPAPPPGRKETQPSNTPRAALVWLFVFIAVGTLFFFRDYGPSKIRDLTQSQFEELLARNRIQSAALTSDGERVLTVSGTLRTAPDAAESADSPEPLRYRTRLLYSEALAQRLEVVPELKIENNNAGWWNLFLMGILPVLLLIGAIYFFTSRQMKMAGRGAMDFGKSRARMIPADELNVHFSDIAGADEAKEEICEIVEYLKDPLRFQLVGGQIPKGCLLVGDPGTGKTLMAKAVACEAGVPFFTISGSDFVEMFVGVGASRVRDMFEQARKNTPCLIFIDEIDAVGRSRFSGWGGGHDEREQTLNAMLVEMDGLESRAGVIVLAATNRPDVLDPALLRPGRFDRQVVMDLPDITGRRQILDVHIRKIKVADGIDLDVVARTTPGFSGADLANLCNEAALLAARKNQETVTQADLEEARDKVSYGRERRSRKITDRERRLTAYHEAGHALVALHNEHCTPVHKVTIIPRGQAYLGATFTMPKEDTYTRSRLELEAEMAMTMGGRAAEELIFGDITTGAAGDIDHLTALAKRMVCLFGMTSKLGPVKIGSFPAHLHVRIDMPPEEPCSQETAREVDLEIRRLTADALESARATLRDYRDELEKLAAALLERETLSIDEINQLLGRIPPESETEAPAETLRPVRPDEEPSGEGV